MNGKKIIRSNGNNKVLGYYIPALGSLEIWSGFNNIIWLNIQSFQRRFYCGSRTRSLGIGLDDGKQSAYTASVPLLPYLS